MEAALLTIFSVGLPKPWPALVSMRAIIGVSANFSPSLCCSWAINLNECSGTTRSSWSAV